MVKEVFVEVGCCSIETLHPPKTNMEPEFLCFVDISAFPRGHVQVCCVSVVYIR